VYSEAYEKGRVALLRFRAESISDYEALDDINFYPPPPEPKYIYYLGESKNYDEWDANVKRREAEQKKFYNIYEEKMIETKLPYKEEEEEDESWWESNEEDSLCEERDEDVKDKVKSISNKVNQLLDEVKSLNGVNDEVNKVKDEMKLLNSKIDQLLHAIIR